MFRALLIVIALIVYGCLYPFRFHSLPPGGWDLFWHFWPITLNSFVARDALLNIVLYLPFGTLAFLTLDRVRNLGLRMLMPLLLACFLSTSIEFVQLMDFTRTSSVLDVACNMIGTVFGITAGRVYAAPLFHIVERTERRLAPAPAAPLLLFCLWLGYQFFPLFPSIGLFAIRAKWKIFHTHPLFSLPETVLTAVEWLAMAAVLKKLLGGGTSRPWFFAFLLILPARLFLLGRSLTPSELAGTLTACVLWSCWLARAPRTALILSFLMVAALILQELSPYHFNSTPQPFSWIPLAGFIETGLDWGAVIFLKKSFWYGAVIWALQESGAGYLRPAVGVALLLGALEWLQRYLPGRTPEITDPILALLLALLLYLFQQHSHASFRNAHNGNTRPSAPAASFETGANP